jgi:hypothetical protein
MSPIPTIFLALPAYGGKVFSKFVVSVLQSIGDIKFAIHFLDGESLIPRARNHLAREFLETNYEWFLFIDTDIIFTPEDIKRLISHNKDIICGLCAKKQIKTEFVVNILDRDHKPDEKGALEVKYGGTGVMLIKRHVFEDMIKAHPEIEYVDDSNIGAGLCWDFFSVGVVNRRYLSEDWYFCERWRNMGGQVFVDTKVLCQHIGTMTYPLPENKTESEKFKSPDGKPLFSLVHATRGRPEKALATKQTWLDRADHKTDIEYIFAVDADDSASLDATRDHKRVICVPKGCNAAFNAAAKESAGHILVMVADDVEPPNAWDTSLLEKINGRFHESLAIAVSDGNQTRLMTQPILTRKRYEQQGNQIFHDGYKTVYADDEYTLRAMKDGVVLNAMDLLFKHNHPMYQKGEWDAGYERQNSKESFDEGYKIFLERNEGILKEMAITV